MPAYMYVHHKLMHVITGQLHSIYAITIGNQYCNFELVDASNNHYQLADCGSAVSMQ